MDKPSLEINTEINELFAKIKIIQKFKNKSNNSLELKEYFYYYKKESIIFSSFNIQIGDSVIVNSKIIKKEKVEEKYTDEIASGNSAILVIEDPLNNNRIIINLGNIPSKCNIYF